MVETADMQGLPRSAPLRQSGVAVVTALLIVAVIATAATYVGLNEHVWLRQAQNLRERAQAEAVRHGALEWAAIILTLDAKDNNTDDLTQAWAQVLPPLPAEGGLVTGQIVDAQGRFNLNNLSRDAGVSADDLEVFRRLLQSRELPIELADTLVDWLDTDSSTQPSGAEDIDYLAHEPPYRAANQRLQSVDELYRVRGYSADIISKLRPFVTALPSSTAINVNTTSAELLQAMIQTLSLAEAQTLIDQRKDDPFKSVEDFKKRLPPDAGLPKVSYDVRSAYFEVNVATMFGRAQRRSRALLQRRAGAPVQILWQQQELIVSTGDGNG